MSAGRRWGDRLGTGGLSAPDAGVFANYELWFQWPITASGQSGARVMRRLGDRWRWNGDDYSVLAGDWNGELGDVSSGNNHYAVSSHPDRLDRLVFHWGQNKAISLNGLLPDVGIARGTSSLWEGWNPGGFDLNYGYTDGSVQQINNAVFPIDERFEYVAMYANNIAPARQNRVPKE